ncbi:hypothetical protein EHO59_05825 [Leptospira semungkisensis]|uniref:Lipoprotein n=1 Tax=Leptospira semungkisensis TaxID=2484985 RepID=A0A4R9G9P5_9LEPT|nr:hypothetical protein [Leptospira semungkisensis]TGK07617.1 hypothetical protein EHO59_05825 [Leptospira semungkisensis]
MKKNHILIIYIFLISLECKQPIRHEPLRFERIQKAETSIFQAQTDSSLSSGAWEYRFKLTEAREVKLSVNLETNRSGITARLTRKGFPFPSSFPCKKSKEDSNRCEIEIKNPESGEYSLVLDRGIQEKPEPVSYRIFAAIYGPGHASIAWEEEIVHR